MANKNNDNKTTDKLTVDSSTGSEDFTRNITSELESAESKFKEIPLPESVGDKLVSQKSTANPENKDFNATLDAIIGGESEESSIKVISDESKDFSEIIEGIVDNANDTHQRNDSLVLGAVSENSEPILGSVTSAVGSVANVDSIADGIEKAKVVTETPGDSVSRELIEELEAINQPLLQDNKELPDDITNTAQEDRSTPVIDNAGILSPTVGGADVGAIKTKDESGLESTLGLASEVKAQPISTQEDSLTPTVESTVVLSSKKESADTGVIETKDNSSLESTLGLASEVKIQPINPVKDGAAVSLEEPSLDNTVREHISDYPDKDDTSGDPILGSYDDKYLNLPAGAAAEKSGTPWVLILGILAVIGAVAWRFSFFESEKQNVVSDDFKIAESSVEKVNNTTLASLDKKIVETPAPSADLGAGANDSKQIENVSSSSEVVLNSTTPISPTEDALAKADKNFSGHTDKNTTVTETIEQIVAKKESVTGSNAGSMIQSVVTGNSVVAIRAFLESKGKQPSKGFVLYGLNFNTASSRISSDSAKVVADLAALLQIYPNVKIRLEGHTDNQGNPEKNKVLSSFRAKAVKTRLVSLSLNSESISTEGLGQEFPITDNGTKAGRLKNRRVEIIIDRQ
jgi:outer membrane protein OmpA-like peptidoglycan-associated protein